MKKKGILSIILCLSIIITTSVAQAYSEGANENFFTKITKIVRSLFSSTVSDTETNEILEQNTVVTNSTTDTSTSEPTVTNTWDISATEDDSVVAKLYSDGTLTIEGTGAMQDWTSTNSVPWVDVRTDITKVEINSGVTNIGQFAFYNCSNIISINLGESIESIGAMAFANCSKIESINVNENNTNYCSEGGILFNKAKSELIRFPEGKGKENISYEIPQGVTSIGKEAFENCSGLTNISIPREVTNIGEKAFWYCSSLTNIDIPEGVTTIEAETFAECLGLTTFNIPDNIVSINSLAFDGCTNLVSINIPNSVTSMDSFTFYGCSKVKIYCKSDSYAKEFAETNNITYETDDIAPTINSVTGNPTDWTNGNVTLTVTAEDQKSGLAKQAYSFDGGQTWQENNTYEYSSYQNVIIKVRDNLGNIAIYQNVEVKIDKTIPTISSVTGNPTDWTNGDVTLTVTAEDQQSGLAEQAYSFDGGQTWQVDNTKKYTENTEGIVIKVKDKVGNIATYWQTINITKITKVKKIEVKTKPNKINYIVGDTLETEGLVITATYNNGAVKDISTGYICTPTELNTIGTQTITVSYEGKTTTFDVTVEEVKLIKIEIKTVPNKINYIVGDTLETEGLVITATYNNGAVKDISTGYICTPTELNTIGTQTITVSYEEKTTTFEVNVAKAEITVTSDLYSISNEYIDRIQPNTTLADLKSNIITNAKSIKAYDKNENENEITDTDFVTTGTKLVLNEELTYTLVVIGDVNGDGKADLDDIFGINKHRLNKVQLTGEYLMAGDVNQDGKADLDDIFQINKFRLGKMETL